MLGDLSSDLVALVSKSPAVASTLVGIINKIEPVLPTVKIIVDDPAFMQVVLRIQTLHAIEESKAAPAPTPGYPTPAKTPSGIGLSKAIPILDGVIYVKRNPWALWAGLAGVLVLIGGVGYKLGRRSK